MLKFFGVELSKGKWGFIFTAYMLLVYSTLQLIQIGRMEWYLIFLFGLPALTFIYTTVPLALGTIMSGFVALCTNVVLHIFGEVPQTDPELKTYLAFIGAYGTILIFFICSGLFIVNDRVMQNEDKVYTQDYLKKVEYRAKAIRQHLAALDVLVGIYLLSYGVVFMSLAIKVPVYELTKCVLLVGLAFYVVLKVYLQWDINKLERKTIKEIQANEQS